jgi:hypothetical protein
MPEGTDQYDNCAALFYSGKMNLAIELDSHTVKRTYPIKPDNGLGSEEGFKRDSKGTVYIEEGGWGAPLRSNNDNKDWTMASDSFNQQGPPEFFTNYRNNYFFLDILILL